MSANAFAGLDSLVTPTTVTAAVLCPKINARWMPNVAKWKFANRTATASAAALPSVLRFVADREPYAWPIIMLPNAPVRPPAFMLAIHPGRKVVAKLNVWPIATVPEQSHAIAPRTLANPFAFKTVAARTPSAWQRTTWPCVLAR